MTRRTLWSDIKAARPETPEQRAGAQWARDVDQGIDRIRELSAEEAHALFDREARRVLGISGEAFVRRWDGGEYDENPDQPDIMYLAMLLPFVR